MAIRHQAWKERTNQITAPSDMGNDGSASNTKQNEASKLCERGRNGTVRTAVRPTRTAVLLEKENSLQAPGSEDKGTRQDLSAWAGQTCLGHGKYPCKVTMSGDNGPASDSSSYLDVNTEPISIAIRRRLYPWSRTLIFFEKLRKLPTLAGEATWEAAHEYVRAESATGEAVIEQEPISQLYPTASVEFSRSTIKTDLAPPRFELRMDCLEKNPGEHSIRRRTVMEDWNDAK
ncbi:hypothetical protein B0H13DRAFT_1890992 [Mycena leptocephala]|nr:hypothetical protein B0H13DRAFT_1890992 [Mycena leptocephala]